MQMSLLQRITGINATGQTVKTKPNKANFKILPQGSGKKKRVSRTNVAFLNRISGIERCIGVPARSRRRLAGGENAPGQGGTVIFEIMLALGAKGRYYSGFGILSLIWGGHCPPTLKMVCCAHPTRNYQELTTIN